MTAIEQHISIPIFAKTPYSLDYEPVGGITYQDTAWPTLEHLLWHIFVPELGIQATHKSMYLRRKVRQKEGMKQMIGRCMDRERRNEFIQCWLQLLKSERSTLETYASMDPIPQFYCVIPKNK